MEFIIKCFWTFSRIHPTCEVQDRSSYQIPSILSKALLNPEIQTASSYSWSKDKYICTHFADKFEFYSRIVRNVWTSKCKSCHQVSVSRDVFPVFLLDKLHIHLNITRVFWSPNNSLQERDTSISELIIITHSTTALSVISYHVKNMDRLLNRPIGHRLRDPGDHLSMVNKHI